MKESNEIENESEQIKNNNGIVDEFYYLLESLLKKDKYNIFKTKSKVKLNSRLKVTDSHITKLLNLKTESSNMIRDLKSKYKDIKSTNVKLADSIKKSLDGGKACFYSRSRQKLWLKGETSGNFQTIKEISLDCDNDTILVKVDQVGEGACHTGRWSCFYKSVDLKNGDFEDEDNS